MQEEDSGEVMPVPGEQNADDPPPARHRAASHLSAYSHIQGET
jgi:hypothetical protein